MNTLQAVQKFLNYFWSPAIRLINEKKKGGATNKVLDWDSIIEYNKEGRGVFFTPNWNFGRWLKIWDDLQVNKQNAKWINCFFIDLDMPNLSEEERKEYLLEHVKDASFVVKTWRWYHVYWVLDEKARLKADEKVFANVERYLIKIFSPYWDPKATDITRLMRVPYFWYWKKWQMIVDLYYVKNRELRLADERYLDNPILFGDKFVDLLVQKVREEEEIEKENKSWKAIFWEVNNLDFKDVVERLRFYEPHYDHNWRPFYIRINWYKVLMEYTDWTVYEPDWWRYNAKENYINNFSNYSRDIRPAWPILPFLYRWFNKNWQKVKNFLEKEYDITLSQHNISENWIKFYEDLHIAAYYVPYVWCYVIKEWQVNEIADLPLELVSYSYDIDIDPVLKVESQTAVYKFHFKTLKWELISIRQPATRVEFNQRLSEHWAIWYWTEKLLAKFFTYFRNNDAYKDRIKIINYEWYYDDYILLWTRIIPKKDDLGDYIIQWTRNIEFFYDNKRIQISLQDAAKIYEELWEYGKYIFVLLLTLFWMNKLDKNRHHFSYLWKTAAFLWPSNTWKTSAYNLFLDMMWIKSTSMVRAMWTTQQPLKTAATYYSPIILEEFTATFVDKEKEDIIRNIISWNTMERWSKRWNDLFIFRSPVLIVWEDLPESYSVINRIAVVFFNQWKKSNQPLPYQIYDIFNEVIQFHDQLSYDYDELKKIHAKLLEHLDARIADTHLLFAYCWSKLGFDLDEYIKITEANINKIMWDKTDLKQTWFIALESLISLWAAKQEILIHEDIKWRVKIVYLWKSRSTLIKILNSLNLSFKKEVNTWMIIFYIPNEGPFAIWREDFKSKFHNVTRYINYTDWEF